MTGSATTGAPRTASRDSDVVAGEATRDEAKISAAIVTISRPAQELYDFWRDFSNLPQIMENVETIAVTDSNRSHWKVKAPGGKTVEWDAVVVEDQPGRMIGWETAEGSDIRSSGRIEFHDAGQRGSVVRAVIAYDPPAGVIGALVAKLFQREPAIQARRDLRRLKQYFEAGEVATSSRTKAHQAEHKAG